MALNFDLTVLRRFINKVKEFLKESINSTSEADLVDLFNAIFRGITKYFSEIPFKSNDPEKKSKEFNHDTSVELINFVGSIYKDFSQDLNNQTHVRLRKNRIISV